MKETLPAVRLKAGREKSVLRRHPWLFSGAIGEVEGEPAPGAVVRVEDHSRAFLAWGHHSPHSQIRVRLLSWREDQRPDGAWLRARLAAALARREGLAPPGGACRLVHGEADGLPGLVVDRFGPFLVLQAGTAGMDPLKQQAARMLMELCAGARGVYERSGADARRLEGLQPAQGVLCGEDPPVPLMVEEDGLTLAVDVKGGQKTGSFLDQRENRAAAARFARDADVLDAFSYTGGFALHCLAGGAKSALLVDGSAGALAGAGVNLSLNRFLGRAEMVQGDGFEVLRALHGQGRLFDLVVLDPPNLAPTRAQADKAARAYKDANLWGMRLLRPGGILATFSCSGGVDAALFARIVAWAALDAHRDARVLLRCGQSADHPVLLSFPESEYLKGLICRIE
jgi:23S rRNA (cytosine1962-C5)-methyltransferase